MGVDKTVPRKAINKSTKTRLVFDEKKINMSSQIKKNYAEDLDETPFGGSKSHDSNTKNDPIDLSGESM